LQEASAVNRKMQITHHNTSPSNARLLRPHIIFRRVDDFFLRFSTMHKHHA
jgi:hypothetical protein